MQSSRTSAFAPKLDASVAQELFLGTLIEENIFPYPELPPDASQNLQLVLDSIAKFMQPKGEAFRDFDRDGIQPDAYIQELRELGLFGIIIPAEYDGLGLSNAAYSRILQQTSRFDASTSLTIGAHSSIGMKGLLLYGTDAQKQKYLPRLASGELIAAFCLTEPSSGSDAGSIKTHALKQSDGNWVLNGEKIWITNGPIADFFTVLARTDSESGKISAFLVERAFGGVTHGSKEDKLGIRASATSSVHFSDVKLPADALLGEEGKGFKIAMGILNNGRTGLGGGCVGGMKLCIELAANHARDRKQFGRSLAEFELIKEKIALMTVDCFAAESAVNLVAHHIDAGVQDFSVEAAATKVFASEALWRTSFEALQVAGGAGFMKEYPYERVMRDSRINMIYEGTNEILRLYIALTGLKVAGQYLSSIGKSAGRIFNDPIKGFGVLSEYAGRRFARLTRVGRDRLDMLHPALKIEGSVFEIYVLRLAKASEALLRTLGKNIIGSQLQSKRVADTAIDIFVGLSVLSRVSAMLEREGTDKCSEELAIARLFTQGAKRRMNANLRRLEHNEDETLNSLAEAVIAEGRYRWDVF